MSDLACMKKSPQNVMDRSSRLLEADMRFGRILAELVCVDQIRFPTSTIPICNAQWSPAGEAGRHRSVAWSYAGVDPIHFFQFNSTHLVQEVHSIQFIWLQNSCVQFIQFNSFGVVMSTGSDSTTDFTTGSDSTGEISRSVVEPAPAEVNI